MDREDVQAGERPASGRAEWIPAGLILLGAAVLQGAGIRKPSPGSTSWRSSPIVRTR